MNKSNLKKVLKIVIIVIVFILVAYICFMLWASRHTIPGDTSKIKRLKLIPLESHWRGDLLEMELEIYSSEKEGGGEVNHFSDNLLSNFK